jgi:hypothetical protein
MDHARIREHVVPVHLRVKELGSVLLGYYQLGWSRVRFRSVTGKRDVNGDPGSNRAFELARK